MGDGSIMLRYNPVIHFYNPLIFEKIVIFSSPKKNLLRWGNLKKKLDSLRLLQKKTGLRGIT